VNLPLAAPRVERRRIARSSGYSVMSVTAGNLSLAQSSSRSQARGDGRRVGPSAGEPGSSSH
jgi:hypothetical protein